MNTCRNGHLKVEAGRCKECEQAANRRKYARNPNAYKRRSQDYYQRHKRRVNHRALERHYQRTYGISLEQFRIMIERQGGLCAACRTDPATQLDHDHSTGKIRGALCLQCNAALGQVKDSQEKLRKLIAYLQ
jgi:hypothetical protein